MTHSAGQRDQARGAIRKWSREIRPSLPRCNAKAKTTGDCCRQIAMANGKCYVHGGRTPAGDGWHKPRWPDGDAPNANEKLNRKLRDRERAAKKRAARLAAMSERERARYEKWLLAHRPGPAAQRNARRLEKKQSDEMRELLKRVEAKREPMIDALQRQIDELEHQLALARKDIFG